MKPESSFTPRGRLAGKIAVITGTGGDQGRVAAQRFATEGAIVAGCDLDPQANQETQRSLADSGHEMQAMAPVDLGDPGDVGRWIDNVVSAYGRIDIVYNNAASPRFAPFAELTLDDWRHTIRNELDLVFHVSRATWPHLIAAGGGAIINTSSYTAIDGQPGGSAAHAAAKGGVTAFTKALAVDGSPYNIRVNSIAPGLMDTPANRKILGEDGFAYVRSIAKLQRIATAADVVDCAVYLASGESSVVTGTEMVIGGGNTLLGPQLAWS